MMRGILNRRSEPGRHPLHRIGLGDDLIDVIAIDALKRALLEALAVVGFAGLITCMVWLMLSP